MSITLSRSCLKSSLYWRTKMRAIQSGRAINTLRSTAWWNKGGTKMTMASTAKITQEEIDSLRCFHEYDFPDGLKARSTFRMHKHFHKAYEKFVIAQLDKIDFTGKSVIDIGCWDGFFSFMAKQW